MTGNSIANGFGDEEYENLLDGMTSDQLKEELAKGLSLTAKNIVVLAKIVKRLETRGEDLSDLKIGIINYLRKIAQGQLCADVLVRFAGRPSLIDAISRLPMDDQVKLAKGEQVKIAVYGQDGFLTHRMADPLIMPPDQFRQAFASDHIRGEAEQVLVLDQRRTRKMKKPLEQIGFLSIDKERGGVSVGKRFISLHDLVAAVKELQGK